MSEELNKMDGDAPCASDDLEQRAIIYGYRDGPFRAIEDLVEIVANPDLDRVSTQPPFRPKACEIYVYECEQKYMDKRTWIYDGYRWRNNGKHKYPKPNPVFEKIYFNIECPADVDFMAFRRCAYIPINKELKYMVVQYLGSECSASTTITAPWEPNRSGFQLTPIRSDPALQDCDINLLGCQFTLSPMPSEDGGTGGGNSVRTLHPSDTQCAASPRPSTSGTRKKSFVPVAKDTYSQNKCSVRRRTDVNDSDVWVEERGESVFKFSNKTFTNIMNICLEMRCNNYFWSFNSLPGIILVFGSCEVLSDLKNLLFSTEDQAQFLTYTTSPCLDGFFISVLSFIHPKFTSLESKNSPAVIPLAFMIHQSKNSFSHSALFNILKEHLSSVQDQKLMRDLVIVSDRDTDVKKSLPSCINLLSLAHIKKEGQCWLTKNMHSKRGGRYMTDLEDMMKAVSKSEFDSLLQSHKDNCSRSWLNFFEVNLQEDLVSHNNNWMRIKDKLIHQDVLEQHQSSALEQVLDDLELCHDATMDKLVQSLYLLQQYFVKELQKGRCGLGTFRLAKKYESEASDPHSMNLDQVVVPPCQIVKSVMNMIDNNLDVIASAAADQGEKIQVKQEPGCDDDGDDDSNSKMVVTKNFSDDVMDTEAVALDMRECGREAPVVRRPEQEEKCHRKRPSHHSPDIDSTSKRFQRKQ